jgi:DNA-binding response OmpR family regulator
MPGLSQLAGNPQAQAFRWELKTKATTRSVLFNADRSTMQPLGRALTRDAILNAVWGHSVAVTPRSIDRCVTTLRGKIEADPHYPVYIKTIRDIGYRFETGGDD